MAVSQRFGHPRVLGIPIPILGDPGADSGGEGKSKRAEKYGMKKSKERREEPLGTMSYQTSSLLQTVAAVLASDWSQKIFVLFCPIRSQNGLLHRHVQ